MSMNKALLMSALIVSLAASATLRAATLDGDPGNEQYFADFSGLNGSATDPAGFTIPTSMGDVSLSGSTVGVGHFSSGVPFLYRSGIEAWIAEPGDVLTVIFPQPMSIVEFFAAAVDGADIEVQGQVDQNATVSLAPNESGIFSFSGSITGFTLNNISLDPDLDLCGAYCASIDDLGFTAAVVPVPAAIWLFGSGLLGLIATGRKKLN